MIYLIRNWAHFQHYKDRNPPWIKLHFELLSSADWVMWDDASRVLAIACMLIASRNEGQIDCSEQGLAYMKRVAYLNKRPDCNPLIRCGFLIPASTLQADASTMLADARPETEVQDLTETEKNRKTDVRENADPAPEDELHDHFNTVRGGRPLKLTTDRKAKYRARLRSYPLEDLKRAIDIALADPWLRGANDRSTDFGFPETVFKNDAAVDRWLSLRNQKSPTGVMTPEEFAERRKARENVSPLLEQIARERAERLTSEEGAT